MDKFYKILRIIVLFIVIISFCSKIFAFEFDDNLGNHYDLPNPPTVPNFALGQSFYLYKNITNNQITAIIRRGNANSSESLYDFYYNTTNKSIYAKSYWNEYARYYYSNYDATTNTWSSPVQIGNGSDVPNSMYVNYDNIPTSSVPRYIIYSEFPFYECTYINNVFQATDTIWNYIGNPFISTPAENIELWNFDTLDIVLNNINLHPLGDYLRITYNNNTYEVRIINLIDDIVNNTLKINKQKLSNYIYFTETSDIKFEYLEAVGDGTFKTFDLGTFSTTLTTDYVETLNNNSQQNYQNNVENGINDVNNSIQNQTQVIEQQTEAIENNTEATQQLENTITDSNIESSANDLPSTDVQDSTQNGIDNIFQSIYNAFCTGQAQDIIFPIPFTDKNITLSPYYVSDMLNNNGASWVYLLIQAFWGYLIGRYIVKDISHKITKIKSGDIENIENNNIKEEML